MRIKPAEHAAIAAAIAAAEAKTSGEIFCVLAREVSAYRDVSLVWAAAISLILPLGLIPLGFDAQWFPGFANTWEAGHLAAQEVTIGRIVGVYAIVQAALFVFSYLIMRIPPVRRLLTPRSIRRDRARQAAMHQFLAHGLHVTQDRTGVLIFAALADQQVEVIADAGIHSRVNPEIWGDAVAALTAGLKAKQPVEGFEKAITLAGDVLAEHFPPRPADRNEVPDRLVEI